MGIFVEIGRTMTTQEYLNQKEEAELDRIFEEYYREINEKARKENERIAREEEKQEAIQQLSDYESEMNILEELYLKSLTDINSSTDQSIKLKNELKVMRAKYTKAKRKVDIIFKEEEQCQN